MEKLPQQNRGESNWTREILPPSAEELMEGCRFKEHQEEIAEEMLNLSFKVTSRIYACEALANKGKYLYSGDKTDYEHKTTASDNANIEKMKQEIHVIDSIRQDMSRLFYGSTEKIIEFDEVAIATNIIDRCNNPWEFMSIDGDHDEYLKKAVDQTLESYDPYDDTDDFDDSWDDPENHTDYTPYHPEYATFGEKLYDYLGYEPSGKSSLPEDFDELKTERPVPQIFADMHKRYVKMKEHKD